MRRWQHHFLKRRARETKKTLSEFVREAIEEYLRTERGEHIFTYDDPLWGIVGLADCDVDDLSINHDRYLYGAAKRNLRR